MILRPSSTSRRQDPPRPPRRHARRHALPILHLPPLFFLLLLSLAWSVHAAPNCLRFADYNVINQAFSDGGPGTKVFLCQAKTYRLTGTIVFTAADQELATQGYPTGADRATLLVNGDFATAVQGDCRRCARVTVSNLIIDGARSKLGRIVDASLSTGLVVIGGNEGQSVKNSWLRHPRGFTAIHVREGDKLQCKSATIEKNEIGPVGEEYDAEVDGPDPEMSPLGRPLADGVSIACRDSYIRENTFYDNTDAAIVLYCSPGTLVHSNTIVARTLSAMAGILLVDSTPFDGDYSGVTVRTNIIDAASRLIRVGIGIGSPVWSDDTETVLKGGSVLGNGLRGKYMGYGIAAAGLDAWTIKDNWDEAVHGGERGARCFDEPINPDPVDFLMTSGLIKNSDVQPGFVDQPFEYVVCIDASHGPSGTEQAAAPVEAKDPAPLADAVKPVGQTEEGSSGAAADAAAEDTPEPVVEGFKTGSEVMDDILEHSQSRMLETIDILSRRVDVLSEFEKRTRAQDLKVGGQVVMSPQIASALSDLQTRVAGIEARQKAMMETALAMRSAMKTWDIDMAQMTYDILLDVQHRLNLHQKALGAPGDRHQHPHDAMLESKKSTARRILSNRAMLITDGLRFSVKDKSWAGPLRWIFAQAIFLAIVTVSRSCWKARKRQQKRL